MNTLEISSSMIDVVITLSQIEVNNIYGIDFFDLVVGFTEIDVFADHFGRTINHPLKVIVLILILNLNDQHFAFAIFNQNIDPVKFIVQRNLIGFTV